MLETNQVEYSELQLACRKSLSYFPTSFENNWTSIALENPRNTNFGWTFVKKPTEAEYNERLNWFQSVRDESSRVQGFTIEMQEVSQLLPNKFWKQLNYNGNWKVIGTKKSAENPPKSQLNAEYNLILS